MKHQLRKKTTLTLEDLFFAGADKYFSSNITLPSIETFPKTNMAFTTEGAGLSAVESLFSIQLEGLNEIRLDVKDFSLDNYVNVLARFRFISNDGYNIGMSYRNEVDSVLSFMHPSGSLYNYMNIENPIDLSIVYNVKENYIDYIVEGSLTRLDGFTTSPTSVTCRIMELQTLDSLMKTLTYGYFKITIE